MDGAPAGPSVRALQLSLVITRFTSVDKPVHFFPLRPAFLSPVVARGSSAELSWRERLLALHPARESAKTCLLGCLQAAGALCVTGLSPFSLSFSNPALFVFLA